MKKGELGDRRRDGIKTRFERHFETERTDKKTREEGRYCGDHDFALSKLCRQSLYTESKLASPRRRAGRSAEYRGGSRQSVFGQPYLYKVIHVHVSY